MLQDFLVINTYGNREILKERGYKFQMDPGDRTSIVFPINGVPTMILLGEAFILCTKDRELIKLRALPNDDRVQFTEDNQFDSLEVGVSKKLNSKLFVIDKIENKFGWVEDILSDALYVGDYHDRVKISELRHDHIVIHNFINDTNTIIPYKCITDESGLGNFINHFLEDANYFM